MRRPPKFVKGYTDRNGTPRFYFRRKGFPNVPLPGLPWSPAFMAAHEKAMAGQPLVIGAARVVSGSLRALAVSYYQAFAFNAMQPRTQRVYRNTIDRLCEQTDKVGKKIGDHPAALIEREHIVRLMATMAADKPEAANMLRRVLRAMFAHAVEDGWRKEDPSRDVKAIRSKTDGFHSWSEAEIEQFEKHHKPGSRARLAFALLLYTGQRRGDTVRMGRQHVRDGVLFLRQQKTGTELSLPLHPELQRVIADTPKRDMTYLTTQFGRPFTSNGFGNWFRDQCNAAGLPQCSAHGLRKAAARRLAEAGCTAHEIAAITGHASLKQVAHYTKAADQQRLATAAMEKVSRTRSV
jgi:integrase